jgi:hypothetical protein
MNVYQENKNRINLFRMRLLTMVDDEVRDNRTHVKVNSVAYHDHRKILTNDLYVNLPMDVINSPNRRTQCSISTKHIKQYPYSKCVLFKSNSKEISELNLVPSKSENFAIPHFERKNIKKVSIHVKEKKLLKIKKRKIIDQDEILAYKGHQKLKLLANKLHNKNASPNMKDRKYFENLKMLEIPDFKLDKISEKIAEKEKEVHLIISKNDFQNNLEKSLEFESEQSYIDNNASTEGSKNSSSSSLLQLIPCPKYSEDNIIKLINIHRKNDEFESKEFFDNHKANTSPKFKIFLTKC